jgi:hypothetical protein
VTVEIPDHGHVEIIRAEVGSTLHGTGRPGQEDTDYMGVCIEPWQSLLGLERFEQWIWRSQPEGVRSGPGDIDLTVYGLKKYLRLALSGNPTVLLLLFVPEEKLPIQTELGRALQALAPKVISQRVAASFLGYSLSQRRRLEEGGHRNRPEMVATHGYDTKYAMHATRIAHQGIEILTTGRITLPIPDDPGDLLRAIRRGDLTEPEMLAELDQAQAGLERAAETTTLPEHPDVPAVERFLWDARMAVWERPGPPPGDP